MFAAFFSILTSEIMPISNARSSCNSIGKRETSRVPPTRGKHPGGTCLEKNALHPLSHLGLERYRDVTPVQTDRQTDKQNS